VPKVRNVRDDVDAFCGWSFLEKLIEAATDSLLRGLISALFETGGRISEVLALRRDNLDFTLHPELLIIKQMILLKRFEKLKGDAGTKRKWKCDGHCSKRWDQKPPPGEYKLHKIKRYAGWVTKPILDYRTFPIRRDEPLTKHFTSWLDHTRKSDNALLFPIGRTTAYLRIKDVGKKLNMEIPFSNIHSGQIYLHWFRAQRACQLAFDYGFKKDDLEEFFSWKERRETMAMRYASLGWKGLARRMEVKV